VDVPDAARLSLVTGGTGFIGRYLVEALVARGDSVRVLGRRPVGRWRRIPQIDHIRVDIAETGVLEGALEGVSHVFHLAAATQGSPDDYRNVTVRASEQLLRSVAGKPGARVIFVSSLSVYDGAKMRDGTVVDEEFPIESKPELRGLYARAKAEADLAAQKFLNDRVVRLTIVRPGIVYGPRMKDPTNGAALALWGRMLVTTGTGDRKLPLIHINDLVKILLKIADTEAAIGRIYNLIHPDMPTAAEYLKLYRTLSGDRRPVVNIPVRPLLPVLSLLDKVLASLGRKPSLRYTAARLVSRALYSADRMRQEMGLEPEVSFREGLERLCRQAA
jgi:nucleoside-diphosphate-sugar epimerase